jgi:hypothetical protein
MNILHLILGAIVLLFGRSLFWLFVAIVGFLVGFEIAQQFAADQAAGVQILIGLGLGAIGALVAMFAQRLGFAIAGFYAGGYLGVAAAQSITLPSDPMVWFVIGGVIGALVAFMMMDWAIVVLSSFVALGPDSTTSAILFIVLAAIGVIFQGRRLQGQAPAPPDQANSAAP